MECSAQGFPVLHCPLEFAQTHVHWVSDAIQPFPPLSSSSSALSLSQHQGLFQWVIRIVTIKSRWWNLITLLTLTPYKNELFPYLISYLSSLHNAYFLSNIIINVLSVQIHLILVMIVWDVIITLNSHMNSWSIQSLFALSHSS